MMSIDNMMEKAADKAARIKVSCFDGTEYIGRASHYCKADDEDHGYSSVGIDTDDGEGWCLKENEIQSIEFL